MAYASRQGRAPTSSSRPQAKGVCDRCGFWYRFRDLRWQYDWRGTALQNLRLLVCDNCLDSPQQQLRAIVVPADPTPIINARVENFAVDEAGSTPNESYGLPTGLVQNAVMPLSPVQGGPQQHFNVVVPLLSLTANGTQTISATCSAPHGLSAGSQISIEGLMQTGATGFYSVTPTTATAFTYQTFANVPAGSLLTSTTRCVTALIGLPRGFTTIPQVG